MTEGIHIEVDDQKVEVALRGMVDELMAAELLTRLDGAVKPLALPGVQIDLEEVSESNLVGRAKLIEVQRMLRRYSARTAWFCSRPLFRGLALVVCHSSGDPGARVFPSREQARAWLAESGSRAEDAPATAIHSLDLVRSRRKKKS